MRAGIKEGKLIVELTVHEARISASGKMDIIAGESWGPLEDTKGNQLAIGSKPLKANACAGFFTGTQKPTPVAEGVKAVHDKEKGVLRISLPMSAEGTPSSTGKMLLHAKTPGGWVNTGLVIDGRSLRLNLTVGVNA